METTKQIGAEEQTVYVPFTTDFSFLVKAIKKHRPLWKIITATTEQFFDANLLELKFNFSIVFAPNEFKRDVLAKFIMCEKPFAFLGQSKMISSKGLYPLFHTYGVEVLVMVPPPPFVINSKVKKGEECFWYAGNFDGSIKNSKPKMSFVVLDEFSGFFLKETQGSAFANTQVSQSFDAELSSVFFSREQENAAEGEEQLHLQGCDSCGQLVILLLSGCAACDSDKKVCEKCIRYNADGRAICKECENPETVAADE